MTTWMTRMSMLDSAEDLDLARCDQAARHSALLLEGLLYEVASFPPNHPEVRMWEGYHVALAAYSISMRVRLVKFGVTDSYKTIEIANTISELRKDSEAEFVQPPWFQDTDVLLSHRSNLQRRWPAEFKNTWKGVPKNMPYLWPFIDDSEQGYSLMLSKFDKSLLASGERSLSGQILEKVKNK